MHFALVIIVPGCLLAGWWQATRAFSGNALSYVYAVEWPIFAIIGVVMWWQVIHEDPIEIKVRKDKRRWGRANEAPPPDRIVRHVEEESDELREYNDYLASLTARGERKGWTSTWGQH